MASFVLPLETIYALGASDISISGGGQLSGVSQGDGSHLDDLEITLTTNAWVGIVIDDNDSGFDDNDGSQRLEGDITFDGATYTDGTRVEAEYRIVVSDPSGVQYTLLALNFNQPGGGPSYGSVEGLVFLDTGNGFPPIGVPLSVVSTAEGPSEPYVDLAAPPCFTPGSRICTPQGLVDIASLVPGDQVLTMDHGLQKVAWIGHSRLPAAVLENQTKFRPVVIRKDAFGPGLPFQDMRVSPQHRILMTGWQAELLFGETEVLVPAIKLCNDHSIFQDHAVADIEYIHVLFEAHEIVWVDGIPTESYLPAADDDSPMATEIRAIFPQWRGEEEQMVAARPCVSDRLATAFTG